MGNTDELASAARKVLLIALTSLATKYHISGDTVTAVIADVVDMAVLGWGIYAHWGQVKVPEASAPAVASQKKVF